MPREGLSLPDLTDMPTAYAGSVAIPPLEDLQAALRTSQRRFWAGKTAALLLIFQGLDTSGKDGCIRALSAGLDPMGFRAVGFGVPTALEQSHDFLWRVQPHLPATGQISLFNRSYYEAVLAERALTEKEPKAWHARYAAIRAFEAHLAACGTTVLKFWLHVGETEQRARLRRRLVDPSRHWKFSPADLESWRDRSRHLRFANEAIRATHTPDSPWRVIPADNKKLCRRAVCYEVLQLLDTLAGEYPRPDAAILQRYLAELEE